MKIMIVDDEPYNLQGLSFMIEHALQVIFQEEFKNQITEKSLYMNNIIIDKANNGLEAYLKVKNAHINEN